MDIIFAHLNLALKTTSESSSSIMIGAIIGGVLGLMLIVVIVYLIRRNRKQRNVPDSLKSASKCKPLK